MKQYGGVEKAHGLSNRLSRSLDQASRSLGSLLNAAVGEAQSSPFEVMVQGAGEATKSTWKASTSTMKILGDSLEESYAKCAVLGAALDI